MLTINRPTMLNSFFIRSHKNSSDFIGQVFGLYKAAVAHGVVITGWGVRIVVENRHISLVL